MRELARLSALLVVVACSKSDKKDSKPSEPSKAAGVTAGSDTKESGSGKSAAGVETRRPPNPKFDTAARLDVIGAKFDESAALATKQGNKAAQDACVRLEPVYQPFCYEGIAAAFITRKGAASKDFEATMAKIDKSFGPIDCQGIGFALEDSPKLLAFAKDLATDQCRASFWDGQGFYRALASAGADTAACRKDEGKAADPAACAEQSAKIVTADLAGTSCGTKAKVPAGLDNSCGHGVGRSLIFMLGGDPTRAIAACVDKNQQLADSCISGVAFVQTFLVPDRADVAFDVLAALPANQKPAFARGMARALAYWRHGNQEQLTSWLDALSSTERREVDRLVDVHDKCASYFDLDKCVWLAK